MDELDFDSLVLLGGQGSLTRLDDSLSHAVEAGTVGSLELQTVIEMSIERITLDDLAVDGLDGVSSSTASSGFARARLACCLTLLI
jgi:hypothetical protein